MQAVLGRGTCGKLLAVFVFPKIADGNKFFSMNFFYSISKMFRNITYDAPGSIVVTDYNGLMSSLWTIEAPNGYKIQLKFDKEHGFAIEYHRRCFYDKLFIINKNMRTKFARLCGPKANQNWPFDALRKLSPLHKEALEMWDVPFDTNSDKVFVAFDTDQSYHFRGFKLDFWFEKTNTKLNSYRDGVNFLKNQLLAVIRAKEFKTNGARVLSNRIRGFTNSMIRAVSRTGAGSDRSCSKGPNFPAPCKSNNIIYIE